MKGLKMAKTAEELELWAKQNIVEVSEKRLEEEEETRETLRNSLTLFGSGVKAILRLGLFAALCGVIYFVGKFVFESLF